MKTMYYRTSSYIQHTGNIIDLNELRRRQALAQQDSLARQPEQAAWEESTFHPVVLIATPKARRHARQERCAWRLDAGASLAVIVMTVAFLLRMLL